MERTFRLGIQVLPITPNTDHLFTDASFAQQFVSWVQEAPGSATDSWNGFVWAVQATYDRATALQNVNALTTFDNGNSKSNMLWWVFTR